MALAPNVAASAEPNPGREAGKSGNSTRVVLILAFAVFFLLGGVTNINDLLVGKFKPMFHLTHAQANLVQMAFFIAYAAFSIPAGIIMSKLGYIRTFVLGFAIVAAAAFLFIPASAAASYPGFLAALFCIGAGITVLQVAMNPVITTLGPVETSHSRLTFAQAFNSIGVFLMVYGGATFLLGDSQPLDAETASEAQIQAYRVAEGASIGTAYMWLGVLMLVIAAIFWMFRSALDRAKADDVKLEGTWGQLTHNRRVQSGALCIFTYVGAEVAIGSNLIAYLGESSVMGLDLQAAGVVYRAVPQLRVEGAARTAQWAREQLSGCIGYWVHVDVDVLDPAVMPAVDAPDEGGIAYAELELLVSGLVDSPDCQGIEITVFDPDYDPDGGYAREVVAALASALAPLRHRPPEPPEPPEPPQPPESANPVPFVVPAQRSPESSPVTLHVAGLGWPT